MTLLNKTLMVLALVFVSGAAFTYSVGAQTSNEAEFLCADNGKGGLDCIKVGKTEGGRDLF